MDASQLQAFSRVTLLGLVLFSMVTWVPHGFSYLRGFLFVSLPSAASAIATPKQCLFVFSNIIVVFLATESRLLSRNGGRSPSSSEDDDIDVVVRELAVFAPPVRENHAAAEEIVKEERGVKVEAVHNDDDDDGQRTQQVQDEVVLEEVMREEDDCEEEATELLPTDELNRRVEDFIARFNMERQLEARMVVCC